MLLQRYEDLVDDVPAFREAAVAPLPLTIWRHPRRAPEAALREALAFDGIDAAPVSWRPGAYHLRGTDRPGATLAFGAGWIHVQEEASQLPVALLGARPGERILDLCAAPGNKTAELALALGERATVVANDRSYPRVRGIRAVTDRLGLHNVSAIRHDGANIPIRGGGFDHVLADVPCSCEGTTRRRPGRTQSDAPPRGRLVASQTALLWKAWQLCNAGGRIVYATCTYAPEENEGVVDEILTRADGGLEVEAVRPEGLRIAPGLTEWQGRRFDSSLAGALRLWPHHNDTGGFFVAVLRKSPAAESPRAEVPALDSFADVIPPGREPDLDAVLDDFGLLPPFASGELRLVRTGPRAVAVVPGDHRPPALPAAATIGTDLIRTGRTAPRLCTSGARVLGHLATRGAVDLDDPPEARRYLRGEDLEIAPRDVTPGIVIVRFQGSGLGIAVLRAGGRLENRLPKKRRLP